MKKIDNIKCWQDLEQAELSDAEDGSVSGCDHFAYPVSYQFHTWLGTQEKPTHICTKKHV